MYEMLPQELKEKAHFCLWRKEVRGSSFTKVPYQPNSIHANAADKSTFVHFETAAANAERFDGIGMGVFDGYCAVDIDHCIPYGALSAMAQDIVDTMDSYTEYSPSGTGVRIIFKVRNPRYDKQRFYINNRSVGLEVYVSGYTNKFVTLTGNVICSRGVEYRDDALMEVLEKYMVKSESTNISRPVPGSYLDDDSVIEKTAFSAQGEKFSALWNGEIPDDKSRSEADLALCSILAFWCGGDEEQMDRLFRRSGLMRDKWERNDYRTATLHRAVSSTSDFYSPVRKSSATEDFDCLADTLVEFHPESNNRYPWNDIGFGRLFADVFRSKLRYIPERKTWFHYQDGVWKEDVGNLHAMEHCKALADALCRHTLTIHDERIRNDFLKQYSKWQNRHTRETVLKDAQGVYAVSMSEFDRDPCIFNCANGTLHLDSMAFTEHSPDDRLTRISPVEYDPNAKCPRFETFIQEITSGDREKARFLQKVLGYALSGNTQFECLFILYGATTRNGKGTLCESILKVLGTYGCTARPETISMKQSNSQGPSEDIARLAGVRFANISEPGKGMILNAALVKSMTGNDTLNARFLRENSFDFLPQFKLFINTNYLPTVNDMTLFSSGRVVIIPFDRHFEDSEQDKGLKTEFRKSENQSAILNWMIEGYRMLTVEGMGIPAAVTSATEAYREDSDKIWQFMQERLQESPMTEVRTAEVYDAYRGWCNENGCYPENSRNFNQALRGYATVTRKRPKNGGGATTMLIGYRIIADEFLAA